LVWNVGDGGWFVQENIRIKIISRYNNLKENLFNISNPRTKKIQIFTNLIWWLLKQFSILTNRHK